MDKEREAVVAAAIAIAKALDDRDDLIIEGMLGGFSDSYIASHLGLLLKGPETALREAVRKLEPEWASFGEVARQRLGMQAQYASRYILGRHGSPRLGKGLRFRAMRGRPFDDTTEYHDILIHPHDVEEFVSRVRKSRGPDQGPSS